MIDNRPELSCPSALSPPPLSFQDVHDRALLYYRLLQQGADVAEKVINTPKRAVNEFAETQSSEAKDRIFDEFNTLSVVFRQVRSRKACCQYWCTDHVPCRKSRKAASFCSYSCPLTPFCPPLLGSLSQQPMLTVASSRIRPLQFSL